MIGRFYSSVDRGDLSGGHRNTPRSPVGVSGKGQVDAMGADRDLGNDIRRDPPGVDAVEEDACTGGSGGDADTAGLRNYRFLTTDQDERDTHCEE